MAPATPPLSLPSELCGHACSGKRCNLMSCNGSSASPLGAAHDCALRHNVRLVSCIDTRGVLVGWQGHACARLQRVDGPLLVVHLKLSMSKPVECYPQI